jgi:NTE family protein
MVNTPKHHNMIMQRIGLALGSGGAKGLAHIAFLKVFDELNIKPSIISGSSMGSVIGALYASGLSAAEIEGLYSAMTLFKVTNMIDLSLSRKGLTIRGKKIMTWLRKRMKCRDFADLEIPLKIVATDFWNRTEVVFEKGDVVDAVRASISLPGIFQPYVIDDHVYIDGGVVNPVPYDLIRDDCDLLVAIDVYNYPADDAKRTVPNTFESIFYTYDIMYNILMREKLNISQPDILVQTSLRGINLLDFQKIREVYDCIEDDVKKFKRELMEKLD